MIYSIEVKDLSVFAGSTHLMGPVSFKVKPGGTLVIMGETGAGKSLIAQAILGTLSGVLRAEGEITVNGRRVDQLCQIDRAALWGREIATLPQEPWRALDPLMRSFKQVKEAHRYVADRQAIEAALATTEAFEALGLSGAEQRLPGALSGGMAQRVAFAAATAANAPILLADEPTSRLDPITQRETLSMLDRIAKDERIAIILVTHDQSIAQKWADREISLV